MTEDPWVEKRRFKSEKHHWFPCSLQQFWGDEVHFIHQLRNDGAVKEAKVVDAEGNMKRTNLGQIRNGHLIFKDGPWASSAEPSFAQIDKDIGHLIKEIEALPTLYGKQYFDILEQDQKLPAPKEIPKRLTETVASIVVRSPRFRHLCQLMVNSARPESMAVTDRNRLIASNILRSFSGLKSALRLSSIDYLLYSDGAEFIFGDGSFHNVSPGGPHFSIQIFQPLTPRIAFYRISAVGLYRSGLELVHLSADYVEELNFMTQVYSKQFIYYANKRPVLNASFRANEFQELVDPKLLFLEILVSRRQ